PASGGACSPETASSTQVSTPGAPSRRADHPAVWTGAEMIVSGGENFSTCSSGGSPCVGSGAAYSPASNSWSPIASGGGGSHGKGVWTGTEMIVAGGECGSCSYLSVDYGSPSAYDPFQDS